MLGEIAIWVLIFIAGFFAGKKFDTLTDFWRSTTGKVKSVVSKATTED